MKAFAISWCGKWLRKVGSSWGPGLEWGNTVAEAKLYDSEKALDKHLLQVARSCRDGVPWPEVVEVDVVVARMIDHSERFQKNRERAAKAEATRRANFNKVREREAQEEIERLEQQLKRAKERAGM